MNKEKRSYPSLSDDVILKVTSFLLGAAASAVFIKGRRKKRAAETEPTAAEQWVSTLPGTDPYNSDTFYSLRLSKAQYEMLKRYSGSMLVFQFYYPQESNCGSPTL